MALFGVTIVTHGKELNQGKRYVKIHMQILAFYAEVMHIA